MSVIHTDGFENYGASFALSKAYVNMGTSAWIFDTGRFSDSTAIASSSGTAGLAFTSALNNIAIGFSSKITNALSGLVNGFHGVTFYNGTTAILSVGINQFGQIIAARSNVLTANILGTSSAVVTPDTWFHMGIEVVRHASAGSVNVYIDGVQVLTISSANTGASAFDNFLFRGIGSNADSAKSYYDDLYVCDTATWLGEARISPLVPTSDTAQLDFTPSTGSDHYALVDEQPVNTTDYVSSSTVGAKDRYGLANLSYTPLNILAVKVSMIAKKDDITTRTFRTNLKSGSTTANGTTKAAATNYAIVSDIFETDPNTGSAWTKSAIDALELGVEVVA